METILLGIFVLGYLAITLEHSLKIDKLIPALIMMALAWAGIAFGLDDFTTWFDSHNSMMVAGFADLPLHAESHGAVHEAGHHVMDKFQWFESTLLHHFGKTCE